MSFKYPLDHLESNALTVGEGNIPRHLVNGAAASSTGNVRLGFFTATKTETVTQVRTIVTGTNSSGATLCRVGVYSVASSGDLTLIASTANDTALWATANTPYTKSLSASFVKVAGQRYAVAPLCVGASPTLCSLVTGLPSSELALAPRLQGLRNSQTDLPSSISAGALQDTTTIHYVVLLP